MFSFIILRLRDLSVAGKLATGIVTMGVLGSVSTAVQPSPNLPTQPIVEHSINQVESSEPVKTTKSLTETEELPFQKKTEETAELNQGINQIKQAGSTGIRTKTYQVTYMDGQEVGRELVSNEITTLPQDEITLIGTYVAPTYVESRPACDSNYAGGCVPIVNYDLDCKDIGFMVTVVGYDHHRFDRDRDGYGCESYR